MKNKKYIAFEKESIEDGFLPSEAYFEDLEYSILELVETEETLGTIDDGFMPNADYLESLEANIMQTITVQRLNKIKKVIPFISFRTQLMIAASIACLIGLFLWLPSKDTPNDTISFEDLSKETEAWYLEQQELFLTDDDLGYLLSEEVYKIEIEDQELQQELENYLIQNEVFPMEIYY